ncbi:NADP-dependent glyceraldehyde-3-phosphate dehydrogenase [Flavobacterium soli]|uniref:NADP-dependent glyceraldehyde-3-phosphate dehydrogenase n=1 Tax=Flavobacterium soli TaxID=344881 RepID=UPI0004250A2A|nr:NADP-dependent glyceraldehyde-3-phosphate dehydrogenase [Flavobacterium soli]
MDNTNTTFEDHLNGLFVTEDQIPQEHRIEELHQKRYLSNGDMKTWDGPVHEVYSPVYIKTKEGLKPKLIGSYPVCTEKEAMDSLTAAVEAYNDGRGEWPTMNVSERISHVEAFTRKMIAKKDAVVKLIMWEIGKSQADSIKEFDRTVEYIYATIDALKDIDRDSSGFQIVEGIAAQVRRSPLGVVLCMGPFNYPLNETFTTLIPALIMGNTILFKPPKFGTLLHYPLQEAFQESFPKGVINVIYGRGNVIIPGLMQSGKINVLTLIGSSRVANELKKQHPKVNQLRAVLGLDAKNASIITQNADLDLAVKETLTGSLSFNGQRCTALKIVFVQKSIADAFIEKFNKALSQLKFGLPWEEGVNLTPLPEPYKIDYLNDCITDAQKHGAKVVNENGAKTNASFFYPAVVYPVNKDMKLYYEEQFGPIVPIVPFDDLEETIQYLINSTHGQQVSIFSNDSDEVAWLIDPLVNLVSRVNVNSQSQRGPDVLPFTGRKDSAEGTLSVTDAIRSFSIRSLVAFKMNDSNNQLVNEIVNSGKSKFLSTKFIF